MSIFLNPIIEMSLPGGWKAAVLEKWADLVLDPEELTQKPELVFKLEKGNITAVKKIEFNGKKISFVVKKTVKPRGLKALADILRAPKSLRNFYLAILLKQKNIEVAEPVAALWHKKEGSIYITEYIPDSLNLYEIVSGKNKEILKTFSMRKTIIRQIAGVIAKLHKANFWHRDAKAGNFIIYKDGGIYKVKLVDLDGIKQDSSNKPENHIRTLSKLAETIIRYKSVNFTDLYRGFLIYCDAMQITGDEQAELFRKVERAVVATRIQTIAADSYDTR